MQKKMSPVRFLEKCEYQGGSLFHGYEYGLRSKDVDNSNPEFKKELEKFDIAYNDFSVAHEATEKKLQKLAKYTMDK